MVADVVIETEHAAWTLVAESARNDLTDGDQAAAIVDAGGWFRGCAPALLRRDRVERHEQVGWCGVAEPIFTVTRQRSAPVCNESPAAPTHVQWGAIQWSQLTALLQDCCEAANLPPIERALARNALEWLIRVGV